MRKPENRHATPLRALLSLAGSECHRLGWAAAPGVSSPAQLPAAQAPAACKTKAHRAPPPPPSPPQPRSPCFPARFLLPLFLPAFRLALLPDRGTPSQPIACLPPSSQPSLLFQLTHSPPGHGCVFLKAQGSGCRASLCLPSPCDSAFPSQALWLMLRLDRELGRVLVSCVRQTSSLGKSLTNSSLPAFRCTLAKHLKILLCKVRLPKV